ncbi:uncharacterized protein BX664DRAFT_333496 [Halteromyces radiatus]|uniref:uncharacterized protein n=1 Tax=Halteromyces radiatus TaxID=101107 RepID=UPI00221E808C|nr:uncharacterized protein BX664DRAFT_333496 [Halteromyces radiatus]KAI8089621.1 hypothetical protein BX664DRAFT_333496 [Halteromyces radiatus]
MASFTEEADNAKRSLSQEDLTNLSKKSRIDEHGKQVTIQQSNELNQDGSNLVSTLAKKDRKKYHKAINLGQKVKISDGKLFLYPKIAFRQHNSFISLNDLRLLILATLDSGHKVPRWAEILERHKIKKVVVVDIPVLDPTVLDIEALDLTISKETTLNSYNTLLNKRGEFFKYFGVSNIESDPIAIIGTGPGDKRRGLQNRFSQLLQCKMTKGQLKKLRHEPTEIDGNVIPNAEELMLTLEDLVEENFPLHHSLQHDTPLPDGWVDTKEGTGSIKKLLAMDCEMCKSENRRVLTKVALVDEDHNILLNEFVKPDTPITDYVTQYSGVDAKSLEGVTTTLADIQNKLMDYIDGDTILVGHGLVNDLRAVKMRHPYIIDTSVIYHHDNGPPYKAPLRGLALRYLNKRIQQHHQEENNDDDTNTNTSYTQSTVQVEEQPIGHDPCEDAIASLELTQLKMKMGFKFGLHMDYVTENILDRLEQQKKTGVVIDVQAKYNNVLTRELKDNPNFYNMVSNTQAVDKAIQQHASNDLVMMKLGQEDMNDDLIRTDTIIATYLEHVRKIYDHLEPDTVILMLTGHYNNDELERYRKKWLAYKLDLRTRLLNEIPENERWTEQDEQQHSTLLELAKRFLVFPFVKN